MSRTSLFTGWIIVALMIVQGAIYFEDGKQLLIDNGVSTTELTGL